MESVLNSIEFGKICKGGEATTKKTTHTLPKDNINELLTNLEIYKRRATIFEEKYTSLLTSFNKKVKSAQEQSIGKRTNNVNQFPDQADLHVDSKSKQKKERRKRI